MSEIIIVIAACAAAVYLLSPLFRRGGPPRLLMLGALLLVAQSRAAGASTPPSIGLLLIAVDAQRDHLRVSEAMRIVNDGPPRELDLTFTLPSGAVYLTAHRGFRTLVLGDGGFRAVLAVPRGVREFAYSYALPSGSTRILDRAFPLPVRRLEIIVRGGGAKLTASRGRATAPLEIGGERLPRWEVRGLPPGESVAFGLRGLPAGRRWVPTAAAGALAALLAGGVITAAKVRPSAGARKVEESPPVRRN